MNNIYQMSHTPPLKVAVLTSCIIPNINASFYSDTVTPSSRLDDTLLNLHHIFSLRIFDFVILVDASPSSGSIHPKVDNLFSSAKQLASSFGYSDTFKSISYYPTNLESSLIAQKGKGLSECLMLAEATSVAISNWNLLSHEKLFFKISARYKISNLRLLVKNSLFAHRRSSSICLVAPCSHLYKYVDTVFYSYSENFYTHLLPFLVTLIDDSNYRYVEKVFYGLTKTPFFVRLKYLPWFQLSMRSGSIGFKHTLIRQIVRQLRFRFF